MIFKTLLIAFLFLNIFIILSINRIMKSKGEKITLTQLLLSITNQRQKKDQIKLMIDENNIEINERNTSEAIIYIISTYRIGNKGEKNLHEKLSTLNIEHYEWNVKEFVLACKELKRTMDWDIIYKHFDTKSLKINSIDKFYLIFEIWGLVSSMNIFPFNFFFSKWNNERTQHDFIFFLIESNPNMTYLHTNIFLTKIVSNDEIIRDKLVIESSSDSGFDNTISSMQPFIAQARRTSGLKSNESIFNCVELFKCIRLLDSRLLIDKLTLIAPEWGLLGLPYILPHFEDIFERLLHDLLKSEKNIYYLSIIFKSHSNLLLNYLSIMLKYDISLSRMLDFILELKILPFISETLNPPYFCFELLILSSRRDHLNIHFWIGNSYNQKRDKFISLFIWYLKEKIKDAKSQVEVSKKIFPHTDSVELLSKKFFPLTFEIFTSLIKTLELLRPKFSSETIKAFYEFKETIPIDLAIHTHKKPTMDTKTSQFIQRFINGTASVTDSIIELKNLLNGSLYEREIGNKIQLYLVENYNNFHKLNEWESMAMFYGKLINDKIFTHSFMNKAQNNVLFILKNSKDSQQVYFSLQCLNYFYNFLKREKNPILEDLEKINSIKGCFVDCNLQLIADASSSTGITIKDLLNEVFYENNAFLYVENTSLYTKNPTEDTDANLNEFIKDLFCNLKPDNFERSVSKFNSVNAFETTFKYFMEHKIYESKNYDMYADFIYKVDNDYITYFIQKSCLLLKNMLHYNVEKKVEAQFASSLGTFLGILTLARNKIFSIETFNIKEFIMACLEKRRVILCVHFTVNFVLEGKKGKIFVPKNPWLMKILRILNEIYDINVESRDEINRIYQNFDFKRTSSVNFIESDLDKYFYLASYSIDNCDVISKHIICLAIDFSVREICQAVGDRTCLIANHTARNLSNYIRANQEDEEKYMLNMVLHLTRALANVSSRQPIRTSIINNISYFAKKANIELNVEKINKVADVNLNICFDIIERTVLTRVENNFNEFFKEFTAKRHILQSRKRRSINSEYCMAKNETLTLVYSNIKYQRLELKPILPSEVEEIEESLKTIAKKMPNKNINMLNKEWDMLVKHIDSNHFVFEFDRILKHIETSNDKDKLCENLCQCLIAQILQSESHRDLLFALIDKVFFLSFKTAQNAIRWIIYGDDERKMDIHVMKGFIRYGLINTAEYDQYIARNLQRLYKSTEKCERLLQFALGIINTYVLGDLKICTPYDFIFVIEILSKMNEERFDERIYETLKKISDTIMPAEFIYEHKGVKYGSCDGIVVYDESYQTKNYAQLNHYKNTLDSNRITYKTIIDEKHEIVSSHQNQSSYKYKTSIDRHRRNAEYTHLRNQSRDNDEILVKDFNLLYSESQIVHILLAGMYVSWDHYIRYFNIPSRYCFINIEHCLDCLRTIDHFYIAMKISTSFMIDGYQKNNYSILRMYCYLIIESIAKIERSFQVTTPLKPYKYFIDQENEIEYIDCIASLLKILSPLKLPIFVVHFIEICHMDFVIKNIILEEDMFFVFSELLTCLNENESIIMHVTKLFMKINLYNRNFLKFNARYFSFLTNNKYGYLKNFFNGVEEAFIDQNYGTLDFKSYKGCYFTIFDYLQNDISDKIVLKIKELDDNQKRWVVFALIDSLGCKNLVSFNAYNILKMMMIKEIEVGRIRDICIYRNLTNAPAVLKQLIVEFKFDRPDLSIINKT